MLIWTIELTANDPIYPLRHLAARTYVYSQFKCIWNCHCEVNMISYRILLLEFLWINSLDCQSVQTFCWCVSNRDQWNRSEFFCWNDIILIHSIDQTFLYFEHQTKLENTFATLTPPFTFPTCWCYYTASIPHMHNLFCPYQGFWKKKVQEWLDFPFLFSDASCTS